MTMWMFLLLISCTVFVRDVNSYSSLARGVAELLLPCCVRVFSPASCSVTSSPWDGHLAMAKCHQRSGAASSSASEVDKLRPLLLLHAFVWGLSTSHSCLLRAMVRSAKALLLKLVFCRFLRYSLHLYLLRHIYTSALCA